MDWTDGAGNVPYDPDMTVSEALDLGLIAVMDTGVIGRTWDGPCGYKYVRKDEGTYTCLRNKNHNGPHARVLRWEESWEDREDRERKTKELEKARADKEREIKSLRTVMARAEADAARKVATAVHKEEEKRLNREWSQVPRNFRDKSAGKIRGPKR